jgi:phosphatidylinositol dimannoside acyltransferase
VTAGAVSPSVTGQVSRRSRLRGRLAVIALRALAGLLLRLPDRLTHRAGGWVGLLLYAVQPRRRRLVRDNLGHVCAWLTGAGLAQPHIARAATNRRALGRLVRSAFGHYVRSYIESLTVERHHRTLAAGRLAADEPALVERVFGPPGGPGRPLLLVGLHFGAIEIPALWATRHGIALSSPMESIDDPDVQAFLLRSRGASGLNLIPLAGAHRELGERLAAGESVAIVADRPVGGSGARVDLFGRPARLPIGPAVLALESGAEAWAVATRRTGAGTYSTRLEPIAMPGEGTRRERLAGFMANQARAFERIVADAPEQWWTLFFPIWQRSAEALP